MHVVAKQSTVSRHHISHRHKFDQTPFQVLKQIISYLVYDVFKKFSFAYWNSIKKHIHVFTNDFVFRLMLTAPCNIPCYAWSNVKLYHLCHDNVVPCQCDVSSISILSVKLLIFPEHLPSAIWYAEEQIFHFCFLCSLFLAFALNSNKCTSLNWTIEIF